MFSRKYISPAQTTDVTNISSNMKFNLATEPFPIIISALHRGQTFLILINSIHFGFIFDGSRFFALLFLLHTGQTIKN
jgi:hypothetical protein